MEKKTGTKAGIQKFGAYLSGMVMPNISAFIAWGLITALFIATGWWPNEKLATMVGPMITYLLPLLIAYTGGKIVYDHRGGVVGAAAAMGVIVGTSIPMFLGAMLMGPLAAFLIKKIDSIFEGNIKSGFEMLINNFTAGILATVLAIAGFYVIGPVVEALNNVLASGVDAIIDLGILPLVHLFVEPAKVLFLNNAINHGIFTPLGAQEAAEAGKSIIFMLESNPGPGLGILLAYMFFGKGISKASASSAAVIHFLGGIHEIYFPYILMKPILIVAAMAGGAAGTLTFSLLNVGLNAAPSPGSIFAYIAMTPRGDFFGMFLGILVAAAVSFVVAAAILRSSKETEAADMELAVSKMESMKGKESSVRSTLVTGSKDYRNVNKIIFACDAGMGSSAMGASILKKKVKEAGINDVDVTNLAINNLPSDVDLVVTHKDLTERARKMVPGAIHVSVDNFLGTNKYDDIVEDLKKSKM
ncbi:PTS mannitol transporter subunit IICB [Proteiniclasticum sp.]|uniref:PTS mannitol transporter subunit IICB n=1 Tax=Proteiniclasticum sp. TaxID=2053595 RepID=UPI00289ADA22|nr:PTS mannitol transporter subunit IICB [Proteiniclasticum sp.]